MVGVAVLNRLSGRGKTRKHKSEIAARQAELLPPKDAPYFFQQVAAYLAKIDPQEAAPEFAPLGCQFRGAVTIDAACEGEGLDLFLFHGASAEVEEAI